MDSPAAGLIRVTGVTPAAAAAAGDAAAAARPGAVVQRFRFMPCTALPAPAPDRWGVTPLAVTEPDFLSPVPTRIRRAESVPGLPARARLTVTRSKHLE